jgi:disulfide bond formation protein DsbB
MVLCKHIEYLNIIDYYCFSRFLKNDYIKGDNFVADTKTSDKLEQYLFIAFGAALIATLGSLYFSEILKYVPCELCWYQRIFMYPQAVILAIAIAKKNHQIALYCFVLSIIGGLISTYHYLIQKVSFMSEASISCGLVPCNSQYINWFGFITIPFLALTAFIIISICCFMIMKQLKKGE